MLGKSGQFEEGKSVMVFNGRFRNCQISEITLNQDFSNLLQTQLIQLLDTMPTYDVVDQNQIQQILSKSGTAVIDCHAQWCQPCKMIAPYATQKSEQTKIPMLKVDCQYATGLSSAYQVQSMPTFLVVKGSWNNVIYRITGGSQQNVDYAFYTAQQYK